MQCRDTAKKGLPVKDDGLNPFTLAISQNANEMTQKGFFFKPTITKRMEEGTTAVTFWKPRKSQNL